MVRLRQNDNTDTHINENTEMSVESLSLQVKKDPTTEENK